MALTNDNAASNLEGKLLNERWKVLKKIDLTSGGTGGKFSIRYLVEEIGTGRTAFLKALNYKAFFARSKDKDPVSIISEQNSAFEYERNVLLRCQGKRLTKVITMYDTGTIHLDAYAYPFVPFLIFEMADGDIRTKIDFSNRLDLAWKLKSLHDVAVGLDQLHSIGVGHQDLKPSNVLLCENGLVSKIGDLGSSLCSAIRAPHESPSGRFTGDSDYIPIEFLYRYVEPDLIKRLRATDMYLFGSLLCFYFTGVNMTNLIYRNINRQFRWNNWNGGFNTVREYLLDGYYKALKEFRKSIRHVYLAGELSAILEYSCYPYPEKRGHPVSLTQTGNQYGFRRIVTRLDVLSRKIELELAHGS